MLRGFSGINVAPSSLCGGRRRGVETTIATSLRRHPKQLQLQQQKHRGGPVQNFGTSQSWHILSKAASSQQAATTAESFEQLNDSQITNKKESDLKSMAEIPQLTFFQTIKDALRWLHPKSREQMHLHLLALEERFSRICFVRYPQPSVMVFDPELVEKGMRNQGPMPSKGNLLPWTDYRMERKEQLGVLTSQGDEWHKFRKVLAKKMLVPRHVQSFEPAMMEVINDQIDNLTRCAERYALNNAHGWRFVENLPNEMSKWSMESIGTVLFETRLGCVNEQIPTDVQGFIDAVNAMSSSLLPAMIFYKMQKRLRSPYVKSHFAAWDTIFAFIRRIVDSRKCQLLEMAKTTEVSKSQGAVLTYLLLDESLDDSEVIANITELLLASVDSTSTTLTWALYELAQNSQYLRQLEAEIDGVIGSEAAPTIKTIHKMPFLKNCVKETLRMYPSMIATVRTIEDDMELDGYFLPKGTLLQFNTYNICRSAKYFEEPEKFEPNRWDRDAGKKFHPFSSIPFGYGPRSCIGKRLAEMQLHLMLARLVQQFELRHVASLPKVIPMGTALEPPKDKIIPIEFYRK